MNVLIELGTEELPSGALNVVYAELRPRAEKLLREQRIGFRQVRVEATPRRIALGLEGLPARQEDQALEFSGPSEEKAYQKGKPTQALEGFLRSKKASLKHVQIKDTPRGRFVYVTQKEKGKEVRTFLPKILPDLFTSLPFAKTMRWEASGFRFPRPIRWVTALCDKKPLALQIAGVKAQAQSTGHRFLSPKPFKVLSSDWKTYRELLAGRHVILSLAEREQVIRKALKSRFQQKSPDEDLVRLNAQLVEEPVLMEGSFSKAYLDLPAEVLATCMKKNQKIFACYDARGRLKNKFVAVLNGKRQASARIRADFENVLESRLRDARFFYETDIKQPLEERLPQLEEVSYLGDLGSMRQKAERLEQMAEAFAGFLGRKDLEKNLKRAARLCKCDLVTQMVFEFPELQGIVGREYALEAGESEEVAQAVGTQYLPKNLAEDFRAVRKSIGVLGAVLGILDRLDLLVGAFASGLEPSGSKDPFALRRAGGSLVKLVRAYGFHFSLREAVQTALDLYEKRHPEGQKPEGSGSFASLRMTNKTDWDQRLIHFFKERVAFELKVRSAGAEGEILQGVFQSNFDNLTDVIQRFEVLAALCAHDEDAFLRAAKVVERTGNIVRAAKKTPIPDINPELFQEPREQKLFELMQAHEAEISGWMEQRDYEKATVRYGQVFYAPVHDFFDHVMVNAEDPQIRANRHALMKRLNGLYTDRLADLSGLSKIELK